MNSPYYQEKSSHLKSLGAVAVLAFVFFLGWNAGSNSSYGNAGGSQAIVTNAQGRSEAVDMSLFWDAWSVLSGNYVDPHQLDTQKMVYGAIHGMVASLGDPYTAFMDPAENKQFQNDLSGNLEGVGIEITVRDQLITVVSPLKDSPAQQAGVKPEDIIYKIDGTETQGMSVDEAAMLIRGKSGTQVTLTLLREGSPEPIETPITRQSITISSVEYEMQDGFGIISINTFGDTTQKEFNRAISELMSQSPRGILLDLRYNGGGYLDGAVDIASEFLDSQKVVTIKKRNPQEDEVIYANGQGRMQSLPLVVLINGGSASASEIVAGALQDYKRAVIVGETSFGKGTVQTVENLIGGSSLRITTAKWFTPNDKNVSETGIVPDVEVVGAAEDYETDHDGQMEAALEELRKQIET